MFHIIDSIKKNMTESAPSPPKARDKKKYLCSFPYDDIIGKIQEIEAPNAGDAAIKYFSQKTSKTDELVQRIVLVVEQIPKQNEKVFYYWVKWYHIPEEKQTAYQKSRGATEQIKSFSLNKDHLTKNAPQILSDEEALSTPQVMRLIKFLCKYTDEQMIEFIRKMFGPTIRIMRSTSNYVYVQKEDIKALKNVTNDAVVVVPQNVMVLPPPQQSVHHPITSQHNIISQHNPMIGTPNVVHTQFVSKSNTGLTPVSSMHQSLNWQNSTYIHETTPHPGMSMTANAILTSPYNQRTAAAPSLNYTGQNSSMHNITASTSTGSNTPLTVTGTVSKVPLLINPRI